MFSCDHRYKFYKEKRRKTIRYVHVSESWNFRAMNTLVSHGVLILKFNHIGKFNVVMG